jgi:O-antigen ligase
MLHFAGALKSTPPLARLGFDLTAAAAAGLAGALLLLAASRDWRASPAIALPLAACGALWVWLVVAGGWSASRAVVAAKLTDAVLIGPPMLLAGLAVGGDAAALRRMGDAAIAIGVFTAATIAWGIAQGGVVLGGLPGANPEQVRVQYQVAGLVIASAAALSAIRAAAAESAVAAVCWLVLVAGLGAAALLPGGRTALMGLALAVAVAPAILPWRAGRRGRALLWPAAMLAGVAGLLAALAADPSLALGLRTLERLSEGELLVESARASLWRAALAEGGAALPFGLGTGGFAIAAGHGDWRGLHPHNHALEALAEGGLPGLVLWLAAFGGGAAAALALAARAAPWRAAYTAALVLPVALTVMVSTDLGNRMAWFALGLALGLGVTARPRHVPALRQAGV